MPARNCSATRGSARAAVSVLVTSSRRAAGGDSRPAALNACCSRLAISSRRRRDSSLIRVPSMARSASLRSSPSAVIRDTANRSARTSMLTTHADRVGLRSPAMVLASALSPPSRARATSAFRRSVNSPGSDEYSDVTASRREAASVTPLCFPTQPAPRARGQP